jgi:deoxyribose-phosphate aldolase
MITSIECAHFAPEAGRAAIEKLCALAREEQFHAVCVNSTHVELARTFLEDTEIRVVSYVGFPLGACDADAKRYETETAADLGAHEIDYVINLGRLKDGDARFVLREMRDIVEAADERPVKAVIEAHLLTREEKILLCEMAEDSGVKFISTSTDFHSPAPSKEDLKLLVEHLPSTIGVKICGGFREPAEADQWISAGAARVGIIAGL